MDHKMKMILKIIFGSMSVGMIILVITTSLQSNLFEASARLSLEPWFNTTLVDFYFNIAIISAWVIYKEKPLQAILWIIGFISLGSIITALYVFLQIMKLKSKEPLEAVLLRKK